MSPEAAALIRRAGSGARSFADFDNDGWQDIYVADGWVLQRPRYRDRAGLPEQRGQRPERVQDRNLLRSEAFRHAVLARLGAQPPSPEQRRRDVSRARPRGGDGPAAQQPRRGSRRLLESRAMDIAVSASTDRHALLQNEVGVTSATGSGRTRGTNSNRDAVGARVHACFASGSGRCARSLVGDGYGSQNSLRQHFGLDRHQVVDKLIVRWPRSGIVQTFRTWPPTGSLRSPRGDDALGRRKSTHQSSEAYTTVRVVERSWYLARAGRRRFNSSRRHRAPGMQAARGLKTSRRRRASRIGITIAAVRQSLTRTSWQGYTAPGRRGRRG